MSATQKLGQFTVRIGLRPDNPAFPVYLIYKGEKFIGKSFSMPDEGCCAWLERQEANRIIYAEQSAQAKKTMKDWSLGRRGRPTNAERAKRAAQLLQVPEDTE